VLMTCSPYSQIHLMRVTRNRTLVILI